MPGGFADFGFDINGQQLELTDLSANADTYQWTVNGSPEGNTPNLVYSLTASGSYNVCLTVANACDSHTSCDTIMYTGIDAMGLANIKVYPNPITDYINIATAQTKHPAYCRLFNTQGQEVMKDVLLPAANHQISMGAWAFLPVNTSGIPTLVSAMPPHTPAL